LGVEEREAGVVVVNDALESVDDAAEKFREFAADDQEIVDFEKNLEAVTLAGELRLIGLGSREIQALSTATATWLATRSMNCNSVSVMRWGTRRPKPMARGGAGSGERKNRKGTYIMLAVAVEKFGKAGLFMGVADDKGLLRLPDPAGGVALDRRLTASGFSPGTRVARTGGA